MMVSGVLFILVAQTRLANAAELQEARVSQVIQDVRLLEAHAATHAAAVNDKVIKGSAVRTGVESRAELTFNDLTITRLGANTIFSFTAGARQAELTQGAILLQVPPNAPAVKANTTSVTVAVMGGTAFLSTGPPAKFMVLEGTGTIYPIGHPEKAVTVHGGEMVLAEGGRVSKPDKFDVKLVLATSALIADFAPLTNLPLILTVVDQQAAEQQVVVSSRPPNQSFTNTIDVTDQNANANQAVTQVRTGTQTPTPAPPPPTPTPPPPTPSKFGIPSTITSPDPYLITSGTTITTDPSITTDGVTDFGKIYRGSLQDGPFTLWAFGSTSAFDTALHLDTQFFAEPSHLPIAAFKFQNLLLNGNPTIDLSNSGVTKLALIGVDGITSGPPGGTLTFTGLDLLVLATVNGSINLTSDVSFQNLNELAIYARGAGSDLTLNSPISNIGILELGAENSIQLNNPGTMSVGEFESTAGNNLTLQIGGSLVTNGAVDSNTLVLPGTTVANGANVTFNITGDYMNSSTNEVSQLRVRDGGAHIGTGGNIGVNIGGNLTAMSDFNLIVQNTDGQIDNGGNITLNVAGSVSTQGALSLLVENYDDSGNPSGHIGTGGNISVMTGEDLTAGSIDAVINNRNGGSIGSGVNLTFAIGGTLTTQGDASFGISNRNDGSGGGVMNGNVTLDLGAANISSGGDLVTDISTNRGGHILGSALNSVSAIGGLAAHGALDFEIENAGFLLNNTFLPGGTIDSDAILEVSAGNMSTATNYFNALISNDGGGHIGGSAMINVVATSGAINAGADAFFTITNNRNSDGPPAGTIAGDAAINVSATSISTGGGLFPAIDNSGGGSIGGNANINFNLTGDLTTQGETLFTIDNSNGGTIGGNATILVAANNITANSLDVQIVNTGGSIGASTEGGAIINMNVSNNVAVTTDATVAIFGSDGAVGGAQININGGNYNVDGTFLSYIDGNGTITFNNATAHADVLKAGVFGANGVLNIGGGILSADSELKLYASGSNGQLNFVSNVTLAGNSLKILAADSVTIFNNVVVTIGGPNAAEVYTNHANYTGFGGNGTTTGTFAGAGANNPQPLANAPPFGPATPGHHGPHFNGPPQINVSNTDELLALLDGAAVGPDGRITVPASQRTRDRRHSSGTDTNALRREARRILMQQMRDRSITRAGNRRTL